MKTSEQRRTKRERAASKARRKRIAGQTKEALRAPRRDNPPSPSVPEADLKPMLVEIVDAAIHISDADFGCIQLVDPKSSALRMVATRGFPRWWVDFWNKIPRERGVCGVALKRGKRVIVEDVEHSPAFSDKVLDVQRRTGVRAIQSTPIVSRSGKTLGVFSTHYKKPHRPDQRTLRLLDLLARQAADIIEHAQARAAQRASEERLKRALDTDAIAVLILDSTGTLIEANDAFLQMTGYTRAEVQGRQLTWRRLTPPEWLESSEQQLEKLAATGYIGPYEKEYFLKDGSRRWMMFVGRDLGDGTILEYCIDVTDRKRMEQEREREGQRKDEFLSLLGHELRNPLAAISFATEMLSSDVMAERRASLEETIARQVKLLRRLVDDLLDLARISHGQISLKRERIDLAEFLQRVGGSARSFFTDRGQELVLRLPCEHVWFTADATRLEQVAMNLLNNASKYTARQGKIELSGSREGSYVVIRCKDNGIGIPLEMQQMIFEPFTRGSLDSDSRGEASLGVGLALVRQLMELHGGTVSVSSGGPGLGSEFLVKLPLLKTPTEPNAKNQAVSASRGRRALSIVIVEDNPDVARTLTIALERAGHKVTYFPDGASTLSGLSGLKPDAALIDIGLPGMDGYELAAKLREKRNLQRTLFIAVSGFKKRAETGKLRSFFDHYLVKPVSLADLLTLLDRRPRAGVAAALDAATADLRERNKIAWRKEDNSRGAAS
ncbi:MAG TPA: ATP-binding protein [Candidatus Dormibacteraeota bacterium]|nr:ATP-binding protein [Candidatus Dormibacteraeota bacterium]